MTEKPKAIKLKGRKLKIGTTGVKKVKKVKKSSKAPPTCEVIIQNYTENKKASRDIQDPEYQHLLRCMSDRNRAQLQRDENKDKYLYPI